MSEPQSPTLGAQPEPGLSAAGVETFLTGLDSPNHSAESRRAWIELFYRDMQRLALAQPAEPGLAEAWARVEAALPEGWMVDGVRALYDDGDPLGQWIARATWPEGSMGTSRLPLMVGQGSTPTAALIALAEKLECE